MLVSSPGLKCSSSPGLPYLREGVFEARKYSRLSGRRHVGNKCNQSDRFGDTDRH